MPPCSASLIGTPAAPVAILAWVAYSCPCSSSPAPKIDHRPDECPMPRPGAVLALPGQHLQLWGLSTAAPLSHSPPSTLQKRSGADPHVRCAWAGPVCQHQGSQAEQPGYQGGGGACGGGVPDAQQAGRKGIQWGQPHRHPGGRPCWACCAHAVPKDFGSGGQKPSYASPAIRTLLSVLCPMLCLVCMTWRVLCLQCLCYGTLGATDSIDAHH